MPEGHNEHALGRLLRTAREARGWNTGDISRRLGDNPDGKPRFRASHLTRVETEPRVDAPTARIVRMLSEGYGIPERLIWDAAGESIGIPARGEDLPEAAVRFESPRYRELSPRHVSLLVAIADAILDGHSGVKKLA